MPEILDLARTQVLGGGTGLDEAGVLAVLTLPDEDLPAALQLAREVRMRWCGPEVEVEGIVSVKTGGCPEDCGYCSQSAFAESGLKAEKLMDTQSVLAAAAEAMRRILVENAASRRLNARCGFREVGVHLRHARLDGSWRDVVTVEVLLDETEASG